MLRITQSRCAAGAKKYFSTADYYSEGQELKGVWHGKGARILGLIGEIRQKDWDALCDNQYPQAGTRLTLRTNSDRTVGYDFTFDVPKSVSVLYAMTRDERILDAFRESVGETMLGIEAEMATRVRKAGSNENRRTGNMVWGEYVHFTTRPVGGVPDPQLHAHCYVFNATFDSEEAKWKAGQFRELKRDSPYFQAVFHSHLAERLRGLGLASERTKKGWELVGFDARFVDRFSRRTAQIEAAARELGVTTAEAKAALGATTREHKQETIPFTELQRAWRERMTATEQAALQAVIAYLGGPAPSVDRHAAEKAVDYASNHLFERRSVVTERQLLAAALNHSVGQARVEDVHRQAEIADLIRAKRNGQSMVTTRRVLGEERWLIDFAKNGRGACRPFYADWKSTSHNWLSDEQQRAIHHVLTSHDRVMLIRGAAGVGKTTLMQEAVEAIERSGTKVFAFAPSADASRGVLRDAGFENADTVAHFLKNRELQKEAAGGLIWVDEAGLVGTKTMAELFALADEIDARVLLTGDRRQHGSVERGAALRLLEEEAGLKPSELKEIRRQSGDYKAAVKFLADGKTLAAFDRLDKLGWIREIPTLDRNKELADDYLNAIKAGKTALVVSPTHAEGSRITSRIRTVLQEQGKLSTDEREFRVLVNTNLTEAQRSDALSYDSGDVLQFHQNAKGFKRGERIEVTDPRQLPLDQAARFTSFRPATLKLAPGDVVRMTHNGIAADALHRLNNGALYRIRGFDRKGQIVLDNGWRVAKDFGHLAYGYVVTSHKSQGKTVDRVFVGQSTQSFPASSREQFYVSCSRGRELVTVYCDDKPALREAIADGDERLSAADLAGGFGELPMLELHRRMLDRDAVERGIERQELSYER